MVVVMSMTMAVIMLMGIISVVVGMNVLMIAVASTFVRMTCHRGVIRHNVHLIRSVIRSSGKIRVQMVW